MKKILLCLFLLIPAFCFAQDSLLYNIFTVADGKVTYTKIIQVDSATKDQLFVRVKDWAAQSYKSQKVTLDAEDKEGGYLVYKGYLPTVLLYWSGVAKGKPFDVNLFHTLRFYIKDYKIKIVFTDIETESHDVSSEVNAYNNITRIEKFPLEYWDSRLGSFSKKKKERFLEDMKSFNLKIRNFLSDIDDFITKKNSEFNF